MATARKLPSGNYRVRIYLGKDESGKNLYKSFTGPEKKKVEYEAAQYNITRKEKPKDNRTVKEAISAYIDNKTNILSPSTIRAYKSLLKNDYTAIENKPISALDSCAMQSFVNRFAKEHSPKTVKNVYALLSSALKESCPDIDITVKMPKKQSKSVVIPTDEEIRSLIAYFDRNKEVQSAILIAVSLGLRRGEICALEWKDIKNHKLHVTKALAMTASNAWIVKSPKTDSGKRVLPLPSWLEENLLSIKKKDKKSDRVFSLTPNNLTDSFIAARKSLGFSFRFHDLRHYNASVMLALGIPDKYAMQRMGHATPNMLKTVYQHLIESQQTEQDLKMNAYMEKFVKERIYDTKYDTES